MPMYKLIEYSKNYWKTTGSLRNYYKNLPDTPPINDHVPPTVSYNAGPKTNSA